MSEVEARMQFWELFQNLAYWGLGISGLVSFMLLGFLIWRLRRVEPDTNGHYFV